MRSRSLFSTLLVAGCVATSALASPAYAQAPTQQSSPALSPSDITSLANIEISIAAAHDSADTQMSMLANKKDEVLTRLRSHLRDQVKAILDKAGVTQQKYEQMTYVVSTNTVARDAFDSTMAKLTGIPLPGKVASADKDTTAKVKVPAGAAGVHIGHIMNSFADTPDKKGLLTVALEEAKTAQEHADLASKSPTNLKSMQLHAGHVMHAIDPSVEPKGPGLGYGVKRAAQGIVTHIELAAKADGASENIKTHAKHVEASAENTIARCDSIIAIAKQIQAATDAPAAAALVNQLVSLTAQLTTGVDANSDGKITWEKGEGGLQQVEQHMKLMIAGENGGGLQ